MKKINQILLFSTIIIVLILGITIYITMAKAPNNLGCGTINPEPFCGTKNLSQKAKEGRNIFNSNCAACHKLDAKSTGPALRGTDSIIYWKWLILKRKIDTAKVKELKIDYHINTFSTFLNEQDLENIYHYISE